MSKPSGGGRGGGRGGSPERNMANQRGSSTAQSVSARIALAPGGNGYVVRGTGDTVYKTRQDAFRAAARVAAGS